jgi:hypothetical protein
MSGYLEEPYAMATIKTANENADIGRLIKQLQPGDTLYRHDAVMAWQITRANGTVSFAETLEGVLAEAAIGCGQPCAPPVRNTPSFEVEE